MSIFSKRGEIHTTFLLQLVSLIIVLVTWGKVIDIYFYIFLLCNVKRIRWLWGELSLRSAILLNSAESFSAFQLIVLVFLPAALLFYFTLTALSAIFTKKTKKKSTVRYLPAHRQS